MADSAHDDPRTVALNARIETDLQAEIDRIAASDSKPGASVSRSQAVRVLLWEAVMARRSNATRAA